MTEIEAKGFIQGKINCMNKCGVFNKEDNISENDCDNCEYCYSQGNFGQQIEAFSMAIKALEKQILKKPRFYAHNYYCSVCDSLVGNNEFEWQRFKYCDTCGQKLNWESDEGRMSDLISRSKVISVLEQLEEHSLTGKMDISNVIYLLNNQQTAYDIDNVVEELETDSSVKLYGSGNSDNYLIPVKRAIEIVKQGGVE